MNLVLDEKVQQWHNRAEEGSRKIFPKPDCLWVGWAQSYAAQRPRQSSNQIPNHEYIVPVMVIRARDIRPSTACQCPENTHSCYEFRQRASWAIRKAVEEEDEHESRSGTNGDEYLEHGAFRVAVSDRGAD